MQYTHTYTHIQPHTMSIVWMHTHTCARAHTHTHTVFVVSIRESVLFIGTRFSNLYTAVDTPAEAAWFHTHTQYLSSASEQKSAKGFSLFIDKSWDLGLSLSLSLRSLARSLCFTLSLYIFARASPKKRDLLYDKRDLLWVSFALYLRSGESQEKRPTIWQKRPIMGLFRSISSLGRVPRKETYYMTKETYYGSLSLYIFARASPKKRDLLYDKRDLLWVSFALYLRSRESQELAGKRDLLYDKRDLLYHKRDLLYDTHRQIHTHTEREREREMRRPESHAHCVT
jgi:hypothetical protein